MNRRLAEAASSYLRSAREQPVDWHPWGTEPFDRARVEDKPVLLDIGAVWCHWCHVMDRESYDDPAVADLLNREYVCIKVDRDERPDVDARYQRAVQALVGQGGWPLTAFLTPDGEVFYGGTYFPPEDRFGRVGFRTVLGRVARLFRERRGDVREQSRLLRKHLETAEAVERAAGPLDATLLERAADDMSQVHDSQNGGFGQQPKFPHPATCDFLLDRWLDTRATHLLDIVRTTLTGMARGGIRDHVGGGFHRYSVDAKWIVPHFEKMTYDNSELLRAYAHALAAPGAVAPDEVHLYRDTVEGIVMWVQTVLAEPAGGYRASQDADAGTEDDGDYFTWTPDEVRAVATADEFEALSRRYDVDDIGEMHHNPRKNVLWLHQSVREIAAAINRDERDVADLLSSGLEKLRRARAARPTPFVDPALYTGWNAMMASAMLEAAALLDRHDVESHALLTLERVFFEAAPGDLAQGGLLHRIGAGVGGLLEDQVHAADAALDAFEATGALLWLDRAATLMDLVWRDYRADDGVLLDSVRGGKGEGWLDIPVRPVQDSPTPSPVGVAGIAFARLAEHTGDSRWSERRDTLLTGVAGVAREASVFGATLLRALAWTMLPATHVVIVGAGDQRTRALLRVARSVYRPRKVIRLLAPGTTPSGLPQPLQAMLDGRAPRAYVCAGTACAAPVDEPQALGAALVEFGR